MDTRIADTLLVLLSSINDKCRCVANCEDRLIIQASVHLAHSRRLRPERRYFECFLALYPSWIRFWLEFLMGFLFWSSSQQFINTQPYSQNAAYDTHFVHWMNGPQSPDFRSLFFSTVFRRRLLDWLYHVEYRRNEMMEKQKRKNENLKWLHWHCQLR